MKTIRQLLLAIITICSSARADAQTFVNENFNSGIPFTWTVTSTYCHNNSGDSTYWMGTSNGWRGQGLSSFSLDTTEFAVVDSDLPGNYCNTDEYLITQIFNAGSASALTLEFDQYYNAYINDYGNVDVFNGSIWVTVATFSSDMGNWGIPNHQIIDLSPYINSNMQVRFHYVANWDWFWAIDNVKIFVPSAFQVSITSADPLCNGDCNGSATATPSGGVSPYNYQWDDTYNQTTQTATGLCDGTYNVTVVDNNGDSVVSSVTITDPPAIMVIDSTMDALCNGDSTGFVFAVVSGGTSPYSYNWSNSATTALVSDLPAGSYVITITDGNGCTKVDTMNIYEPSALVLGVASTDDNGNCDGTASVNVSGGTSPYSYQWDANAGNQTTQTADSLCAGSYCVTVTDNNGCTADTCVDVQLYTGKDQVARLKGIKLFPNPSRGMIQIISDICCNEAHLTIVNAWGEIVLQEKITEYGNQWNHAIYLPDLKNGLYLVQLSTMSETVKTKLIIQK